MSQTCPLKLLEMVKLVLKETKSNLQEPLMVSWRNLQPVNCLVKSNLESKACSLEMGLASVTDIQLQQIGVDLPKSLHKERKQMRSSIRCPLTIISTTKYFQCRWWRKEMKKLPLLALNEPISSMEGSMYQNLSSKKARISDPHHLRKNT